MPGRSLIGLIGMRRFGEIIKIFEVSSLSTFAFWAQVKGW